MLVAGESSETEHCGPQATLRADEPRNHTPPGPHATAASDGIRERKRRRNVADSVCVHGYCSVGQARCAGNETSNGFLVVPAASVTEAVRRPCDDFRIRVADALFEPLHGSVASDSRERARCRTADPDVAIRE